MVWGALIGGAFGAFNAAQDRKANAKANAQRMAAFNQYKPFVDANLSGSQTALGNVINTGAYSGPTYAGPNTYQTGTANTMGGYGMDMQNAGYGMMANNAGFGANYRSMYDDARTSDRLSNAIDYAGANSGALTDAIMRDDRRNLQENTLTGINMAASGSGNVNSSRAGVQDAIANRAFNDRRADVQTNVANQLVDRSLAQQGQQFNDAMAANAAIQGAYGQGMSTLGQGANFGMNAGNFLQAQDQARLNDQRSNFERQRDFELEQRKAYQSGMLGKAPATSGSGITANKANVGAGFLGGAMTGHGFQQKYFPDGIQIGGTGSLFGGNSWG